MARYLTGLLVESPETHLVIQDGKWQRFAWCAPTSAVRRITQLVAEPDRVTCPTCRNGSLMWFLMQKAQPGFPLAQLPLESPGPRDGA